MTSSRFLQGLNPEQRLAVETTEGPLLVLAGAGSGKTRVITHRIAHLLEKGVSAERILAVTFTNKAAAEMKERIRQLVGEGRAAGLRISTFHSFGLWLVRRNAKALRVSPASQVIDESDRQALLRQVRQELGITDQELTGDEWSAFLMKVKGCGESPEEVAKEFGYKKATQLLNLLSNFNDRLVLANQLDFDDLILLPVRLLSNDQKLRDQHRGLFDAVLVDEYQDTNLLQFQLLKLLVDERENLCVVGDDDQSIYGWRGARVENILEFDRQFPRATVIKLTRNYRSEKNILDIANAVISKNQFRREKELWTQTEGSVPIRTMAYGTDREEAQGIATQVNTLLRQGVLPEDVAVLYRTKGQSRAFQESFRMAQVPYRVVGSFDFFERKEVRDFLAYLRLASNLKDDTAFLRVVNYPLRGIGTSTLKQIQRARGEDGSLFRGASNLLDDTGSELAARSRRALKEFLVLMEDYHRRLFSVNPEAMVETVRELLHKSGMWDDLVVKGGSATKILHALLSLMSKGVKEGSFKSVPDFLERITLQQNEADFSSGEDTRGKVTLMTIHSAKGLEYQGVFLVGLGDGLFPHVRSVDESGIEEERRLFYVALTRARRHLTLSWFKMREERGEVRRWSPSRFMSEIPTDLVVDGRKEEARTLSREEALARFEAFEKRLKK